MNLHLITQCLYLKLSLKLIVYYYYLFNNIFFSEPRRKDFEFDRGETDRYRNYDRFKGSSNYDRRRNDSYRTQEEPEWMTG